MFILIKDVKHPSFPAHLLLHEVRKDPQKGDGDRAGKHLCPSLQSVQRLPDQLRLGSKGGVNDHHKLLAVDQEILKNSICFLSMEGVRVEEVEPDKLFRWVECLTVRKNS